MCNQQTIPLGSRSTRQCALSALINTSAALAILLAPRWSAGASPAFDSAADPAYNFNPANGTGWAAGSNGGFGWGGPWEYFNTPTGFPLGFVGSSTTNGTGDLDNDGDINTPRNASGRAWGLTARPATDQTGEGETAATRMLNGPLSVGQTFKIDMDNGVVADPVLSGGRPFPGAVGWSLRGGGEQFGLEATGDSPHYFLLGGSTQLDSGIPLTYEGLRCEFTLLPAVLPFTNGWIMKVTPLSPGAQTYTFTGARVGAPIELVVGDSGGGLDPANAVYFNNISVGDVPEPGAVGVVGAGAALLLRRRRRATQGATAGRT